MSHIDDYRANHVDHPINVAPFLGLHQAAAKEREKKLFFNVETLLTLSLQLF